jgi:hypothetical protein
VVARTHKKLIWDRTHAVQRPRHQLQEYFPAALEAFGDLDARDALQLLGKAPDPARAARLTRAQISAAFKRVRRQINDKTDAIMARAARRAPQAPGAADCCLRGHRPVLDRGHHHPQRAGHGPG